MNAPSAQGVCGFAGKVQSFDLSDVIINTTNDYVVVNVVAMDEKPIRQSAKLLVQVGTVYQPTNWSESPSTFTLDSKTVTGFKINNTGKMPWKCANTQVSIKLKGSRINQATILNAAGYAVSTVNVIKTAETVQVDLPANAMYVVLENTTKTRQIEKKETGMNVFPNPANGNFNVEINEFDKEIYSFELRGLRGEKVREMTNIQHSTFEVDTSNLSGGIFFAVLKNEKGIIETKKICIQNN
jgi:hypothetical protein